MLINSNVVNVLYAHRGNKVTHKEENKSNVSIFKFNQVNSLTVFEFGYIKMKE